MPGSPIEASFAKISGSCRPARSFAWIWGANSRAQKSRTVATSCSWSGVSARSSIGLSQVLLLRARRRAVRWSRGTRGRGDRRVQVAWLDVADHRQVLAEAEDDWHRPGAVELWRQEVRVDLLQLMDSLDVVKVGSSALRSGVLQILHVLLGDHGRRDRVGENCRLELVDLIEAQARTPQNWLECVVEGHESRDSKVNHDQCHQAVDEDAKQAVDPADGFKTVKCAADRASGRSQDHGKDEGDENCENGLQVQVLFHSRRVLVVESKDQEDRAKEEDLGHQRLDHALLVADDHGHDQDQDDDDVNDHWCFLMRPWFASRHCGTRSPDIQRTSRRYPALRSQVEPRKRPWSARSCGRRRL